MVIDVVNCLPNPLFGDDLFSEQEKRGGRNIATEKDRKLSVSVWEKEFVSLGNMCNPIGLTDLHA